MASEITREQLSAAFGRPSLQIQIDKLSARDGDDWIQGHVRYPWAAADVLLGALRELRPAEPDGDVVDTHICCDHADADPDVSLADIAGSHVDTELALMAAILHGMDQLDRDARQRIRNWVDERFVPRRPADPF